MGIDVRDAITKPEDIFRFVNDVFDQLDIHKQSEQRISERRPAFLPVQLQSLDTSSNPIGDPIDAITRDISVGGLGILSPTEIAADRLMVKFHQNRLPLVMIEVSYQIKLGPCYLIGGSFTADWTGGDHDDIA